MNSSFTARWNEALIDDNYERWRENPEAVDLDWRNFFEGFELGCVKPIERNGASVPPNGASAPPATSGSLDTRVDALVYAYRSLGHSISHLDPLSDAPPENPLLTLKELGLDQIDFDSSVSSRFFRDGKQMKLRDLIAELKAIYCGTIGAEFIHIQNPKVRNWVRDKIENRSEAGKKDSSAHSDILRRLLEAEEFEQFLHTRYQGNKRFSLEGGESLILALNAILDDCERHGIREIIMGMAHRGRLNVLANFLDKPLTAIFNEFSENYVPDSVGGSGDVKYHLGYQNSRTLPSGYEVEINLAANPSHLEAVDPVVQGKARARQRLLGDTDKRKKAIPVLVHGDAAFIGQGVVAEVFNMSQLPGYSAGGTVHIVVNNQIGFTTLPADGRSTMYCTDIAKIVEAPIFHVNGEDPLAVIQVAKIALEFRQEFGRDAVVDIYCYRRHGHNELDEPSFTQPGLYNTIKGHPLLSDTFSAEIEQLGTISKTDIERIKSETIAELEAAQSEVKSNGGHKTKQEKLAGSTAVYQPAYSHEPVATAITADVLEKIVHALSHVPDGFRILPKLKRILLDRRHKVWEDGGPYDWSYAEALAFGSLLLEHSPVRLSGQDSRRGTFSQRLSVIYDEETRDRYIPLNHLATDQAKFCVYNSPLSEYAVLGFDYGYSMDFPEMLCLWEAQFGDFVNGAQIIIDQFITSAEAKWFRPSSIVMLLPHGYEGQGPEHSSARLERFLQSCAEDNIQVCNLTTPAQYFHVLRRQLHRDYRKPLVIMTPKSLLRSERAVSRTEDFTDSAFSEILPGPTPDKPKAVDRLIFCSGKVYYDLLDRQEKTGATSAFLIRIEQLYPLYEEEILRLVQPYTSAKTVVWCQEEPENMGAASYIRPHLERILDKRIRYAGRKAAASPATGSTSVHKKQQAELVAAAFEI
jgi:2-oxoglutarate dehydrogenase E1 component